MKPPIRIDEVEEFEAVRKIQRASINETILVGVRQLNEKKNIEPFLREILPDPNDTPHNSAEIVDILTTQITLNGQAYLTAFVNKGKSFPRITAKEVSHQFHKLERLPNLGLIVLLAVGDILDEVVENFLITSQHTNTEYMIVDAIDIARLFIAHHKICPQDGYPYADGKCPNCGTLVNEPIELTLKVYEEPRYQILSYKDVSSSLAKWYSAEVLTDPHYSKTTLREVIKKAIWELRKERYYGSEQAKKRFGDKDADIVYLFVFLDMRDKQQYNWVCQAIWIDKNLPTSARPWQPKLSENLGEIGINWKSNYEQMRNFWLGHFGSKEEWIQKVESLIPQTNKLFEQTNKVLADYEKGTLEKSEFEKILGQLEHQSRELSFEADEKLPPLDCEKCDSRFYAMMGSFHNIFIPFADFVQVEWDWEHKIWMMQKYVKMYEEDKSRFLYEWQEIKR